MKKIYSLAIVFLLLNLASCGTIKNYNRNEDCERILKAYNQILRWDEAEKAAIAVVDRPMRDEYSKMAEAFRRRHVSMVDIRTRAQECLPEQKKAEATVEIDYYIMPDNRLKTLTDRQKWIYREKDDDKPELGEGWKLVSPMPDFK